MFRCLEKKKEKGVRSVNRKRFSLLAHRSHSIFKASSPHTMPEEEASIPNQPLSFRPRKENGSHAAKAKKKVVVFEDNGKINMQLAHSFSSSREGTDNTAAKRKRERGNERDLLLRFPPSQASQPQTQRMQREN